LAGQTIEGSGLRDRDIVVLSLSREGKIIPNPRGTRELQVNDLLVCFGKIVNMKDLLPEKIRERGRRKLKARVSPKE
jgi:ribosomal protein S6--L-glutamate ligase